MLRMQAEISGRGNATANVSVKGIYAAAALATGLLGSAGSVLATAYTWSASTSGSGNWTDTTKWTPNGTPGSSDSITVNGTSNMTISLNGNQAASSVTFTNYSYSNACAIKPTNSGDTLTLSGATAITKIANGYLTIGDSAGTLASSLALANSTTFRVVAKTDATTSPVGGLYVYSQITGSSSDLTIDGDDALVVNFRNPVANTFRDLTVNNGTVSSGTNFAISAGNITIGDGNGAAASAKFTYANSTSLSGKTVTVNSDGQFLLDTPQTAPGTLNLAGGNVQAAGASVRQLMSTTINATGTNKTSYMGPSSGIDSKLVWRPSGGSSIVAVSTGNTLVLNGQISKDLNADRTATKTGAGTWVLANGTTASGSNKMLFTVRQGTLQVNANSLGSAGNNVLTDAAAAVTLGDASTPAGSDAAFVVGGAYTVNNPITVGTGGSDSTRTIGGVNAGGTAVFAGAITLGQGARLTAASGGKVQFTGVIGDGAGTSDLSIIGAGTIELIGANTYDGITTIQGALIVSNTTGSATGTGEVTIDGGSLSGTGTIQGTVQLNTGTLSPGNSPGRLTVGGLTLTGGTVAVDINGTSEATAYDQIVTSGNVAIGTGAALSLLTNGYTPGDSDYIWLINNTGGGTTTGHFTGLAEGSTLTLAGKTFAIHYNAQYGSTVMTGGNDVVLTTVIPEPQAAAIMGTLMSLCLLVPRHRRRTNTTR